MYTLPQAAQLYQSRRLSAVDSFVLPILVVLLCSAAAGPRKILEAGYGPFYRWEKQLTIEHSKFEGAIAATNFNIDRSPAQDFNSISWFSSSYFYC